MLALYFHWQVNILDDGTGPANNTDIEVNIEGLYTSFLSVGN